MRNKEKIPSRWSLIDKLIALSYPLGILCLVITINFSGRYENASAIGGKIEEGKFFLITPEGKLILVDFIIWLISLITSGMAIVFSLIMMFGVIYGFIKYWVPYIKDKVNGPHNRLM